MSQPNRTKPMLALIGLFGLLPVIFTLLVFMPVRKRMKADQARLDAAIQRDQELPSIQPLTAQERTLLEDTSAPWRTRIPLIASDAQRLAHYHQVVTDLQTTWRSRGVTLLGVRSTWNPINASFTLPSLLGDSATALPAKAQSEPGQLQAWVLEARVDGSPTELFKALETLPQIHPLLEPVGLRWESDDTQHRQLIILRNLVTIP